MKGFVAACVQIAITPNDVQANVNKGVTWLKKAVDESRNLVDPVINRKSLKEKCWKTLIILRQHILRQTKSEFTDNIIMKINSCLRARKGLF